MSRCFPYPPPGYYRNGVTTYEALIESIKLQKETVKADKSKSEKKKEKREKKERKKEKREKKEKKERRKEKSEKEKRKDGEKQMIQENPRELHLNSQDASIGKTEPKTVKEPRTEQLEKSDLTEEHCQPISSQTPSYSSDSTQNSNKRKRDVVLLPDGYSGQGKHIKILLLRKHKPNSSNEVLCTNSGRSDPTCLPGVEARLNPVSSNRTTGLTLTSGRENDDPHGSLLNQTKATPCSERPAMKNDLQGLQFGRKQSIPSSSSRPSSNANKTEAPVPSRSKKSDVEVLHSSRLQPISCSGRPLLPPSQHGISSSGKRPICEVSVAGTSGTTRIEKKKEDSINVISKNLVPANSGPTRVEKKKDDLISEIPKEVGHTRHEKKMQKKHSKYEKVIRSWVPPVVEARLPVDEDWLSRMGPKIARTSRDDIERFKELASVSLWQPCARFLVEDDIYALPYTVPF